MIREGLKTYDYDITRRIIIIETDAGDGCTGILRQSEVHSRTLHQMQEVADIISLSYLAKRYFNKSRSWLYQRMNGNIVNGKPARFTSDELATLNRALKDISEKLGSLSVSY